MDFEPYFKVHNLVSTHPKSIILGQMINLDMIFHVVVSVEFRNHLLINWTSKISVALSFTLKFYAGSFQPFTCGLVEFAMSLFVLTFCLVLKEMD